MCPVQTRVYTWHEQISDITGYLGKVYYKKYDNCYDYEFKVELLWQV